MNITLYPWQASAWAQWQQLRPNLPHAILFHGQEGIGKTAFAKACAASLLCEKPTDAGHACGQCLACGWLRQYSHPDYRRVRPEVLEEGAGQGGGDDQENKKSHVAKAPSKDIKIEQVRSLGEFMNVSTHRGGARVILLYPVEALNMASANALLKMLEEPPPHTVFLLVGNNVARLLPTILSRCHQFALGTPSHEVALAWLEDQQLPNAQNWLAEYGGAPLAALHASRNDDRQAMEALLQQLAQPAVAAILKTAEVLQKTPSGTLVTWLQRWLFDVLLLKFSGTIRYYPRYRKEIERLAARVEPFALLNVIKTLGARRMIANHPLAPKLFIEDMLLDYVRLFP